MKYPKLLLSVLFYTFITVVIGVLTPFFAIVEGKKAFYGYKQIYSLWAMLWSFLWSDTKRVAEPYKMKLYGKYRNFRNTEYITIDFSDVDLVELFAIGYLVLYASFFAYAFVVTIICVITYTAVYYNPEVELLNEPVKKPVITYQKMNDEINMDTYCPCTPSYKMNSTDLLSSLNTLVLDDNNGEIHVSNSDKISLDQIQSAKREINQGDISVLNIDTQITLSTLNDLEFKVNPYQGFVFVYDLSSIFFFNEKGEMFRIARS